MSLNTLTSTNILVVDDQSDNVQTMTTYLEEANENYDLLTASNGKIAYNVAQKLLPDLIITDWDMPQMNGLQLTQALKQNPVTKDIPILLITGVYTTTENLRAALDAGAFDYVRKPIQKIELWARVSSVLSLMNSYRTIKDQHQEIERKNKLIEEQKDRELNTKILELHQKTQILRTIQERLDKIDMQEKTQATREVTKIIRYIDNSLDLENEWQNFKSYFEKVHPSFFTLLQEEYPKLTTEDLRYCAYVKTHMSNKEIANLLNINTESVRTHKYRLKKKLGLPKDVELKDFINQLLT
jgi:response regulator RpfG family c-di-GMP phosphodiesterase/DNA-binding CsgD family transcriptional regulator